MTRPNAVEDAAAGDFTTRFWVASNRHDPSAVAACFTVDATVEDDGTTYTGHTGIGQWVNDYHLRFGLAFEPNRAEVIAEGLLLNGEVSGAFPGSPLTFDYVFTGLTKHPDGLRASRLTVTPCV